MAQSKVGAADVGAIRKAFAHFPSGVAVLAVEADGAKHAIVASSFMVGVSLEPTLVAIAVQKSSETWSQVRDAPRLGVSIFSRRQSDLIRKLAGRDRATRFDQVRTETLDNGAVLLDDAALWLETSVHRVDDAGDHWLALLEVVHLGVGMEEPLVWHGSTFRELAVAGSVDVS